MEPLESPLGRVYPLMAPATLRDELPDVAGGVGTPRMVYDPETGGWLLFFTGWRSADAREVFVAEVDEGFSLSGFRKVLSAPPNRDAVNAMYNPWLDGFTLLTTEAGLLWVRHLTRELREVASRKLADGMQDSGAGALALMGGYSEENPNAVIFYPRRGRVVWRFVRRLDDLSSISVGPELTFSEWEEPNDVIDAFRANSKFGVLVEYYTDRQSWRSRVAMCGDYLHPKLRALSAPLPVPFTDAFSNFGHPSFTTGPDGRPKVLFSFFMSHAPPFPVKELSRQWRHEIWVWEPAVDIFNPKTYGRMCDLLRFDQETAKDPPVYDLMGAERLILKVAREGGGIVELRVQEAATIKDCLEGVVVEESFKVRAPGKVVIERPLNAVRLSADVGTKVWVVAEY